MQPDAVRLVSWDGGAGQFFRRMSVCRLCVQACVVLSYIFAVCFNVLSFLDFFD